MCDLAKVHADILKIADIAADLAFSEFEEAALDDFVMRSAIRQTVINLGDIPEGIFADALAHTRQLIQDRIKGDTQ